MSRPGLFRRRILGFPVMLAGAVVLVFGLALGVYLAKTLAGRERAEIARVEAQIGEERRRLRLLEAEVAFLEQPERLTRLSVRHLGLEPVPAARETPPELLPELALRNAALKPASVAAPARPAAAPVEAAEGAGEAGL